MTNPAVRERLLRRLPDIPRFAETRGMLRAGTCEVIGLRERDDLAFVARETNPSDVQRVCVVGRPDAGAIRSATEIGGPLLIIVAPEDAAHVRAFLPDWTVSRAVLHTLDPSVRPEFSPNDHLRTFGTADLDLIRDEMPPDLGPWLDSVVERDGARIAYWADGKPVSFCCCTEPTESLWNVAIDTLPRYQRRGYATRCAAWMIHHMRDRGLEPVWGAEADNVASLGLARRLGFRPVDELVLLEPPKQNASAT
jgi:RimJ/RimL family protein N-acetyltransferase